MSNTNNTTLFEVSKGQKCMEMYLERWKFILKYVERWKFASSKFNFQHFVDEMYSEGPLGSLPDTVNHGLKTI